MHAEPVLTPLWLLAWWRQFGEPDGRALRVVAVEDGGELVGLVPLATRGRRTAARSPCGASSSSEREKTRRDEIASDYVGGLAAVGGRTTCARLAADALVDRLARRVGRAPAAGDERRGPARPQLAEALRARGLPPA